MHVEALKGEGV